jgi:hypothetical protein
LKSFISFSFFWINRRIADSFIILQWTCVVGNWKTFTWTFFVIYNAVVVFLLGLIGLKARIIWKAVRILVTFFVCTVNKV